MDDLQNILSYWFGETDPKEENYKHRGNIWWAGHPSTDKEIKDLFQPLITEATLAVATSGTTIFTPGCRFNTWCDTARGSLALVILLDQFPRHVFRGQAQAFATDKPAQAIARHAIDSGFDLQLGFAARFFVYNCLGHAEDVATVKAMAAKVDQIVEKCPQPQRNRFVVQQKQFAIHVDLLVRFGRYPHRNLILGRVCTSQEREYLEKDKRSLPPFVRRVLKSIKKTTAYTLGDERLKVQRSIEYTSGMQRHTASTASAHLKILVLHGLRGGKVAFRKKTRKLRQNITNAMGPHVNVQFIYAEGPYSYVFKGQEKESALERFGGVLPSTAYQKVWWTVEEDPGSEVMPPPPSAPVVTSGKAAARMKKMRYVGVETSLRELDVLIETHDHVDGVIGFSQGATLAALLAHRIQTSTKTPNLKFVIAISGFVSRDPRHAKALAPGSIAVPSLHICGAKDLIVTPDRTADLAKSFTNAVLKQHAGGHSVPNIWPYSAMCEFMLEVMPELKADATAAVKPSAKSTKLKAQFFPIQETLVPLKSVAPMLEDAEAVTKQLKALVARLEDDVDAMRLLISRHLTPPRRNELENLLDEKIPVHSATAELASRCFAGLVPHSPEEGRVVDAVLETVWRLCPSAEARQANTKHRKLRSKSELLHSGEAKHSGSQAMADIALTLWLQTYARDPEHTARTLGRLAEVAGWPALARMAQLAHRAANGWPSARVASDDKTKDKTTTEISSEKSLAVAATASDAVSANKPTISARGWEAFRNTDLQPRLQSQIVEIISSQLRSDVQVCLPPSWRKYFLERGPDARVPTDKDTKESKGSIAHRASVAALEHMSAHDSVYPSMCGWGAPRIRQGADKECNIAHDVSAAFLGIRTSTSKYQRVLTMLKKILDRGTPRHLQTVQAQRKDSFSVVVKHGSAEWLRQASRPISDRVLNPEPEPVVPATKAQLNPLLQYLHRGGKVDGLHQFERGTVVPDGRLDLCKQVVGPEGIGPLAAALANASDGITRLLLGNNIIGDGGAEPIANLIRSGKSKITTWYIAGNRLTAEGLAPICEALATDTQVDMLWLKRNPLKAPGATVLSKLLSTNRLIHTLDLNNTGLLDEGALIIIESFKRNAGVLKHLYLDSNGLTVTTATALGKHLASGTSALRTLAVSTNRFGDEGVQRLCEGLRHDRQLLRLELSSNRLGPNSALVLVAALASHPALVSLSLGFTKATVVLGEMGNSIGDEGAEHLAKWLQGNRILRSLNLLNNGLTQKGVDYLLEALRHNTSVVALDTTSWGMSRNDIAQNEMESLLARNLKLAKAKGVSLDEVVMPQHVRDIYSVYRVS